jgi:endonuclease YncB( thermonuclease family)
MRRFRARFGALSILITAIALLSCLLVLMLLDERPPVDDAALAAAATIAAVEAAAPAAKLDERMEAAAMEAQAGRHSGDLSMLSPFEVAPPLRSIDGASFRDGERIVRLAGVEAPRANEVCLDGEERWSCGLQARAALHNTVANRSLSCQPRGRSADGGVTAACRLEARDALPAGDVAHLLVRQGWARPMPDGDAALAADMAKAKAAGAGLWRGDWRIVTP